MTAMLAALAPVFALILAGFAVRRARLLDRAFWVPAERLVYFGLFPALLLHRTATADLAGWDLMPVFVAFLVGVGAVSLLQLALRPRLGVDGPGFTSVLQASIRPNVYVGLAAAAGLYGETGLALAAVSIAGITPLVNLVSVAALSHYGHNDGGPGLARTARALARNPIILSVVAGMGMNLAGLALPPIVAPTIEIAGRAALPLSLLAVGASLDPSALGRAGWPVVAATVAKFLLLPAIVWAVCQALDAAPLETAVAVLFAALPTSTTGYIMARQLGGDHALLANVITIQTLLAVLTLPVTLALVG